MQVQKWFELTWMELDLDWFELEFCELGFVYLRGKICDIFDRERNATENDKEKWVMGG